MDKRDCCDREIETNPLAIGGMTTGKGLCQDVLVTLVGRG